VPLYLKYYFWLLLISVAVFTVERIFSATPKQEVFRQGFGQDLFWLLFNTQYASWMLAILSVHTVAWLNAGIFHLGLPSPESLKLISAWPLALQFIVFFVLRDFVEWNVHRVLHRVPWLWEFHKLHHSSERLDWLTTFRAHWGEMVIYKIVMYLPLVILGVDERVIFAILVLSLLVQEIIHANLRWDWGPFRYIINSPRLHAWHHAVEMHGAGGQNFGVTLSIWDWLFGTFYSPKDGHAPAELGFDGLRQYPTGIWARFWRPFARRSHARKDTPSTS
jgi:sterol desaturase/sphingolipid hydroxylase (fatty acid hydroxylase superfamily)